MVSDAAIRLLSERLRALLGWRSYLPALLRVVEDLMGGRGLRVRLGDRGGPDGRKRC